ncbi:probable leucine-rich repeat receptor-like protein kinase At1g35710 [Carya illinoinensis]|uniref:probable leucine-rich repeat receptor-like protein kinase At1g35710 n=1 Tax=Carya illinoinensis TaxID=32201 RepID=UPI001C71B89E|nr:probable leucine-rich repeat receptor-like protein kinase At1g35710 [Carya illinoinensis]
MVNGISSNCLSLCMTYCYITISSPWKLISASIIHLIKTYMASSVPINSVALLISVLFYGIYLDTAADFVAASELDFQTLRESGWWSTYYMTSGYSSNPCMCYGITCNDDASVTKIYLYHDVVLGSTLNLNFASLTNLTFLVLVGAGLRGSIPPEIGILSKLTYLDLSYNNLTGEFPDHSLRNLTRLDLLDISKNRISGCIPPVLGDLLKLTYLDLSYNSLTGSIPSDIAQLTNQRTLILSHNNLKGSIPIGLGSCTNLKHLSLSNYSLTGSIPRQIGYIRSIKSIGLSHNFLSGEIPYELWSLPYLDLLDLSYNNLTGKIPDGYWNRTSLALIGNKNLCDNFKGISPCLATSPAKSTKYQFLFPLPSSS